MGVMPNTEEYEKMMRLRKRKERELLADPTAVGGPPPGRGPSYGVATIAGGGRVKPQSGAGSAPMPFGIEAQQPPKPGMVGATPSPVAAPVIPAGPTTRTIGSGVKGLEPDQLGEEIRQAAQDRGIMAQRLTAVYRAAQAARSAGNLDEYNRLMDQWQGGVADRRENEAYGRNLSLAKGRTFVTPEQAAKSHAALPGMIAGARQQAGTDALQALDNLPHPSVVAGEQAVPGSLRRPAVAPQDEIRRRGFIDFAGQEPTVGPDGNVTTLDAMEQAKRANLRAKIVAEMNQPAPEAVPFDRAAYDQRMTDAQARAETASVRLEPMVKERQAAAAFRKNFAAGERDVAVADQERRKNATDTESLLAKAKYNDALRTYNLTDSANNDQRAETLYKDVARNIDEAIAGNANAASALNGSLTQLEQMWDSLSVDQRLAFEDKLLEDAKRLNDARPGFWDSLSEIYAPSWLFGNYPGSHQKKRTRTDETVARFRGLAERARVTRPKVE